MSFSLKDPSKDSGIKIKSKTPKGSQTLTEVNMDKLDHSISSNVEEIEASDKTGKDKSNNKLDNKNTFIAVGIGLAVVVSSIVYIIQSNNSGLKDTKKYVDDTQLMQRGVEQTTKLALTDEEKLQAELNSDGYGIDSATKDLKRNSQTTVQSDTFVKDLSGQDIPEMFEVKTITYISDFVTYTKHRAVTGDGIELYWLDGKYKGQPCKLTMPYKYFKEIPDEGAVICKVEIVQTKDGNKLATWFQFDPDSYDKLIKKK